MLCILEDMLVVHYTNPAVNAVRRAQGGIGSMESIEAG
uniref:Uncharacterized protein n=1 Tax=Anopheles dirus TaxID=7168 RepID=A0A182NYN2_9DIPT